MFNPPQLRDFPGFCGHIFAFRFSQPADRAQPGGSMAGPVPAGQAPPHCLAKPTR